MELKSNQSECDQSGGRIYAAGDYATLESYNGQYTIDGTFAEDVYDIEGTFEFISEDGETLVINGANFEVCE